MIDLPPPVPIEVVTSFERVDVGAGPAMGLVGLHYLRRVSPGWAVGPSVFAPVTGDRGGFFGWGLSAVHRWQQAAWSAEAGLFVGGGGGSPVWVGSGLMLRPHLALGWETGPWRLAAGVSHLGFAGGTVQRSQPFVQLGWSGWSLFGPAGGRPEPSDTSVDLPASPFEAGFHAARYTLVGGSARRDGAGAAAPLHVAGVTYRRFRPADPSAWQTYWVLSVAGSLTSVYPGYAELLGGVGVRHSLPGLPGLALQLEATVGSGGGGVALDTAGGRMHKLTAGLAWQATPHWTLSALAGHTGSAGRFRAREARVELAWRGLEAVPEGPRSLGVEVDGLAWVPWSASAGWAQHLHMRRDDGREPGLGVMTLKLARELGPHWRLVVQAAIAAQGRAGGYATGQLGAAWMAAAPADSRWRLGAEATLGAAGGGGVRTDGGLIAQAQAIVRYELSPDWALQLDAGWLRSRRGVLSTPVLGLSAVHAFSRLQGP